MRFQRAVWFAGAILCTLSHVGMAQPLDLSQRHVLIDCPSTSVGAVSFEADEEVLLSDVSFAVFTAAEAGGNAPGLTVNGEPVWSLPVPGPGGRYHRLHPLALSPRSNSLTLEGDASRIVVFSLLDTFEEVHFGHAFAEARGVEKVQPAAHPDQLRIDVLHYDLDITLNMNSRFITVAAETRIRATDDSVTQVVFDFLNGPSSLVISSVTLEPSGTPLTLSFNTGSRIGVALPVSANTGDEGVIRIEYAGTPDASAGAFGLNSFNRTTNNANHPLIYTFNEPYSGRSWFPCKDIPEDKATADIRVTCPTAYTPVANGRLVTVDQLGGGLHRYHWNEGYPMATYLLSVTCTDFAYASDMYVALDGETEMEVGHYVWPNSTAELAAVPNTIEILGFFAGLFGEYPFLDEKYVTATWGGGFGMEHQTCTSINNGNLLSYGGGPGKSRRNIHELSHMWFGDLVTMEHFDHLWLNEGWATYCEALYREHDEGFASYIAYVSGWIQSGISDTTPLVYPNADSFAGSVVYRRGGYVLHMLRHVMGDAAFFEGTRAYLTARAYGNSLTDDLQDAMESATDEDLDWFFDEWVYGIGRPNYQWQWFEAGGGDIQVAIDQVQSGQTFDMPVDLHLVLSDESTEIVTVRCDERNEVFTIAPGVGAGKGTGLFVEDVLLDPLNYVLKRSTEIIPPAAPSPTLLAVRTETASGDIVVEWESGGGSTSGFEVQYFSEDGLGWESIANADDLPVQSRELRIPNPVSGRLTLSGRYRVRALSDTEAPSAWSDVYGLFHATDGGSASVLVVDGYDRGFSSNPQPHAWAAVNGDSVVPHSFDTCANEMLGDGFTLTDYEAVVWVLAEESTADETFSSSEQGLVSAYLRGGGRLFATGAEIGWDLDRGNGPTQADRDFYNGFLKADYASDDSDDYDVTGVAGSIFEGLGFAFDDGSGPTYHADYPDVINAVGGSVAALQYSASTYAAVQFEGLFPAGAAPGKVVTMGFGFETILVADDRRSVMQTVLEWFGLSPAAPVDHWAFE